MQRAFGTIIVFSAAAVFAACSSSSQSAPPANADAGSSTDATVDGGTFVLSSPCSDSIDSIYSDPGAPGAKGAIARCAHDRDISKDQLEQHARTSTYPYDGKPFTSGARVYRVVYTTERGNDPASAGYTSALVFLPDNP